MTKTYPLRLPILTTLGFVGILALMSLMALAGLFAESRDSAASSTGFVSPWVLLVLGFFWYMLLSVPQRIVHHADDTLEFKAPLRKRIIAIDELQSIKPVPGQYGMLCFRSARRSVTIVNQFDGFHELIATIKSKNPGINLVGC